MLRYCFSFVAIYFFILLSVFQLLIAEAADKPALTENKLLESVSLLPSLNTETKAIVDTKIETTLSEDSLVSSEPQVSTLAKDSSTVDSQPQALEQSSKIHQEKLEESIESIKELEDKDVIDNQKVLKSSANTLTSSENGKSEAVIDKHSVPTLPKTEHLEDSKPKKVTAESESLVTKQKTLISDGKASLIRPNREGEKSEGRASRTLDDEEFNIPSSDPIIENIEIVNALLSDRDSFFSHARPKDEIPSSSPLVRQAGIPEKGTPILTRALPIDEEVDTFSSTSIIKALLEPTQSRRLRRKADLLQLTTNSHSQDFLPKKSSKVESPPRKSALSGVSQFQDVSQKSLPSSNSLSTKPNEEKVELEKKDQNGPFTSNLKPSAPPVGPSRLATPPIKHDKFLLASKKFRLNLANENKDTLQEVDPNTILSHTISSAKGTSLLKGVESTMVLQNLRVPEIRTKSAEEVASFHQRHPNVCGNGICEEGETCESCRKDCGVVTLGQLLGCGYAVQRCHPALGKAVVLLGITENKSKFMTPDTLPASISTRYPIHRSDSNRPIGILPRFEPPTPPQETLKHTGLTSFVFASHMREMPNTVNWFVSQGYQIVSATKCKLGYDGPFLKNKDAFNWELPQDD